MTDTGLESELVITVPPDVGAIMAHHTKCRMTLGVLVELVTSSLRRVVIASPFIQEGSGLYLGPLNDAIRSALQRGVSVEILCQRIHVEPIKACFCSERKERLIIFCPNVNLRDDEAIGSHAKFCISDTSAAYIGSANLTGPGLSVHLEMGVLIRGLVASQVAAFWDYGIESGLFVRIS